MNLICLFIIFALMIPAICTEPMKITSNSNAIISSNVKIPDNAKPLCDFSPLENTTEIKFGGEEIFFKGLGDLVFADRITSGQMLTLVDWSNHEMNILRNGGGSTTVSPGNESMFKITGKNLRIIEPKPCAQNAPSGGIICKVNFTSRKISFFDPFSAL
jgi:hypothetical protein